MLQTMQQTKSESFVQLANRLTDKEVYEIKRRVQAENRKVYMCNLTKKKLKWAKKFYRRDSTEKQQQVLVDIRDSCYKGTVRSNKLIHITYLYQNSNCRQNHRNHLYLYKYGNWSPIKWICHTIWTWNSWK